MESIRSEHQVGQWFDTLPIATKKSQIRQFYHLFCDSSDGDLRTNVKAILEKETITYDEVRAALGNYSTGFKAILKASESFKEFVDTVGA